MHHYLLPLKYEVVTIIQYTILKHVREWLFDLYGDRMLKDLPQPPIIIVKMFGLMVLLHAGLNC